MMKPISDITLHKKDATHWGTFSVQKDISLIYGAINLEPKFPRVLIFLIHSPLFNIRSPLN